jgi:hypothetical protein
MYRAIPVMELGHRGPKLASTYRRPKGPLQSAKGANGSNGDGKGTSPSPSTMRGKNFTLAFDYAREEEDDNGKGL